MYSSHRYSEGHVFFREGAVGTSAYIIKSGRVEISITQAGKEIVLCACGPGEIFGEMALLGTQTRTATARAIERTEAISISRAHLLSLLRQCDPLLKHIVLTLVNRLKQTNAKIRPEKADHMGLSFCRLLAMIFNGSSASQIPFSVVVEQIIGILSLDASDCYTLLDRLQTFNLIELEQGRYAKDKVIRLVDTQNFLAKAEKIAPELERTLAERLDQESVYIDIYDLAEHVGVERQKIHRKIRDDDFPVELLLFKKADVLKWLDQVGVNFLERKKRVTVDELETLDQIVHVRNSVMRTALGKMEFYQICQLLKAASEEAHAKILSNLSGRLKQVVEQELELIADVDEDEVEDIIEDLLEHIRTAMAADGVARPRSGAKKVSANDEAEDDVE